MENQTITASDMKWLRSGASRSRFVLPLLAAFSLCMCLFHLYMAASWAKLAGLTFIQAEQDWLNGIDWDEQYSGVYIKTMEQFDGSILMLMTAIFVLFMCYIERIERKRKARLLAAIAEQGQVLTDVTQGHCHG